MCQKWAEERGKRNDYRLSIPSIFLFPGPPTFHVPLTFASSSLFHIFPTTSERGKGYSQPVCGVWQVHAKFFLKHSLCTPEYYCSIACGNCKTKRQESFSLPVYSVFKQHFIEMASLITQSYCLLLT